MSVQLRPTEADAGKTKRYRCEKKKKLSQILNANTTAIHFKILIMFTGCTGSMSTGTLNHFLLFIILACYSIDQVYS